MKGRSVNVIRVESVGCVISAEDSLLSVGNRVSFTGSIDVVGAQVVDTSEEGGDVISSVWVSVGETVLGVAEG